MAHSTVGRKRVVESEVETIEGKEYNVKNTRPSDDREGVIVWNPEKVIVIAQINNNQQTSCNESMSMETVDPDQLDDYVDRMLADGWVLSDSLADERNDI